jgi:hypothetical protein
MKRNPEIEAFLKQENCQLKKRRYNCTFRKYWWFRRSAFTFEFRETKPNILNPLLFGFVLKDTKTSC